MIWSCLSLTLQPITAISCPQLLPFPIHFPGGAFFFLFVFSLFCSFFPRGTTDGRHPHWHHREPPNIRDAPFFLCASKNITVTSKLQVSILTVTIIDSISTPILSADTTFILGNSIIVELLYFLQLMRWLDANKISSLMANVNAN